MSSEKLGCRKAGAQSCGVVCTNADSINVKVNTTHRSNSGTSHRSGLMEAPFPSRLLSPSVAEHYTGGSVCGLSASIDLGGDGGWSHLLLRFRV